MIRITLIPVTKPILRKMMMIPIQDTLVMRVTKELSLIDSVVPTPVMTCSCGP